MNDAPELSAGVAIDDDAGSWRASTCAAAPDAGYEYDEGLKEVDEDVEATGPRSTCSRRARSSAADKSCATSFERRARRSRSLPFPLPTKSRTRCFGFGDGAENGGRANRRIAFGGRWLDDWTGAPRSSSAEAEGASSAGSKNGDGRK